MRKEQPTLQDVLEAISWQTSSFESMSKVVRALADLARQHGARDEEIAEVAANAVGYERTK